MNDMLKFQLHFVMWQFEYFEDKGMLDCTTSTLHLHLQEGGRRDVHIHAQCTNENKIRCWVERWGRGEERGEEEDEGGGGGGKEGEGQDGEEARRRVLRRKGRG